MSTAENCRLTALAILPNQDLAQQYRSVVSSDAVFDILAEWKTYPSGEALERALRELTPDVLLLDLSFNLEHATAVIELAAQMRSEVAIVALHTTNDANALLRALRAGATEFLYAPFSIEAQKEAAARIRRLFLSSQTAEREPGKVVVFTSVKPGSGASTLAVQTAFALQRVTGQKVLLVDFHSWNGTISLLLGLQSRGSVMEALRNAPEMDSAQWASLIVSKDRLDVLPAPETPCDEVLDPAAAHKLLDYARRFYDWIVVDLPLVFDSLILHILPETDQALLVSTTEMPSLHLARRAVSHLGQLGFGPGNFHVVVNRVTKYDGMSLEAMGKIFNAKVHASFPNDYLSMQHALISGLPLRAGCDLSNALEQFARNINKKAEPRLEQNRV